MFQLAPKITSSLLVEGPQYKVNAAINVVQVK